MAKINGCDASRGKLNGNIAYRQILDQALSLPLTIRRKCALGMYNNNACCVTTCACLLPMLHNWNGQKYAQGKSLLHIVEKVESANVREIFGKGQGVSGKLRTKTHERHEIVYFSG